MSPYLDSERRDHRWVLDPFPVTIASNNVEINKKINLYRYLGASDSLSVAPISRKHLNLLASKNLSTYSKIFHDKSDKNDKVSINLCQSLSWATFQIPCHSCHLCHSEKGDRYISPFVMNTGSDSTRKWACHWPIGLAQRATDSGYQFEHLICVYGCVFDTGPPPVALPWWLKVVHDICPLSSLT